MSVSCLIWWLIKNCLLLSYTYNYTAINLVQLPICNLKLSISITVFWKHQIYTQFLRQIIWLEPLSIFLGIVKDQINPAMIFISNGLIDFSHCTEKFWWSISICKDTHKRMKSSSIRKNPWSYLWKNLSLTCLLWNLLVCLWIWYRSNKKSY